jgi:hypothetical protein
MTRRPICGVPAKVATRVSSRLLTLIDMVVFLARRNDVPRSISA